MVHCFAEACGCDLYANDPRYAAAHLKERHCMSGPVRSQFDGSDAALQFDTYGRRPSITFRSCAHRF